ncbi:hypothetical protein HYPDE_23238 [Hyphomicrobium denitrificans 1NES1]|uniref:Nucleotidyltransferase-like domain-containing protein n=2 Tax=Hyphomicrobium denitrificans TaxID=53399 RepID=N0AYX3_9HYPH|nr:hypothetical protein HYPDE_23238 [Hyphomicrobium denitrificans 1NES1]
MLVLLPNNYYFVLGIHVIPNNNCLSLGNRLKPIPLNLMTLYSDLAQNVRPNNYEHGSVITRKKKGRYYLFVVTKDGSRRVEKYIGAADNPDAQERAEQLKAGAEQAKALRTTVSALKQARIPSPSLKLGKILEVIANEGLFEQGIVLIGTAAFQTYAALLGYHLRNAYLATQDADLLVASFVGTEDRIDMETILQRADPTFKAKMHNDDQLPKVFKSKDNFSVDILTKFGRGRKSPIVIDELGCSAEALPFMEYLAEESVEAVALYGTGVLVRVPPPVRYAIHKLLIAQERRGLFQTKKAKDLAQARDILDILLETDPDALEDALEEARSRGPKWKKNINASLKEMGRETRQGRLPIEVRTNAKKERA